MWLLIHLGEPRSCSRCRVHQTCLLSVREPCQISPVQHGQSLLNWLREIQNSLSAECTDRAAKTRHCETDLRKGMFFFSTEGSSGGEGVGREKNKMQQELPISSLLKRSLSAYSIMAPTEGEKSRHFNKIHHCLALTLVSLAKGLERINLICSKSFTLRPPFPLQRAHPWLPRAASCSNSMLAMCTRVALRDSAGGFG